MKRINARQKRKSLERVDHWSMLLDIAVAPHTEKGTGIRSLNATLKRMRQIIENDGKEIPNKERELQDKLVKLNQRRKNKAV